MQVSRLKHREVVRVDTDRLNRICGGCGEDAVETAINAAMEDLAQAMQQADRHWRDGNRRDLRRSAARVAGIADRIGLTILAEVATVVAGLATGREDTALAATLRRMVRLGEGSLIAIWEAQDISI